ncbi:hypothetical protein D1AOALGA4SA_4219 [Olavius algarvensis Delta 1 endosymbiont]|nr:hypothetical protein D1AOALGA4SA_4219 [Olavius algarvensis Delta 1 endosymbiont]
MNSTFYEFINNRYRKSIWGCQVLHLKRSAHQVKRSFNVACNRGKTDLNLKSLNSETI